MAGYSEASAQERGSAVSSDLPETTPQVRRARKERLPRRYPAQTRELMFRAAMELIAERAMSSGDDVVASVLAHVKLTAVAKRATQLVRAETGDLRAKAITTGAIYQQWQSQAEFQADLLFRIADVQATLVPGLPESLLRFREARAQGVPIEKVLLRVMEDVHRHYREDPMYRVELGFLVGAHDPRLREALVRRQESFYASVDEAYKGLLEAYGLRMREPFAVRDLSRVIASQIAGSVVTWYADPALLEDPLGEENASLMSRAVLAIFERFTEPVPGN